MGPDDDEYIGYVLSDVARLIRTAYGPFQLGQLAPGGIEEIPARLWREKLGIGRKKRD